MESMSRAPICRHACIRGQSAAHRKWRLAQVTDASVDLVFVAREFRAWPPGPCMEETNRLLVQRSLLPLLTVP
jgi:hypothetical protein